MSTDWRLPSPGTPHRYDAAGPGSKPLTSAKEARELMMRRAQAARRSPAGLGEIRQDAAPARKPVRSAAEARARMIRERRT
jgi:hypothetical protein